MFGADIPLQDRFGLDMILTMAASGQISVPERTLSLLWTAGDRLRTRLARIWSLLSFGSKASTARKEPCMKDFFLWVGTSMDRCARVAGLSSCLLGMLPEPDSSLD